MKKIAQGFALALTIWGASALPGLSLPGGTLPLKLGNGGTLPLSMSGEAATMSANGSQVTAQMVLTQVTQDPMSDAQGATLVCQLQGANISKHAAHGSITLGDGQYAVKGICYSHDNSTMEIVGERLTSGSVLERSFMTGSLSSELPHDFSGRMVINGTSPHAGRYTFAIRCPGLMHPADYQ